MSTPHESDKPIVLVAEDDLDDILLMEMSFRVFENSLEAEYVKDGEELMEYLRDQETCTRLGLILLDLNMPKIDGRQALLEIKGRADLKDIPIVIWTTMSPNPSTTWIWTQRSRRSWKLGLTFRPLPSSLPFMFTGQPLFGQCF